MGSWPCCHGRSWLLAAATKLASKRWPSLLPWAAELASSGGRACFHVQPWSLPWVAVVAASGGRPGFLLQWRQCFAACGGRPSCLRWSALLQRHIEAATSCCNGDKVTALRRCHNKVLWWWLVCYKGRRGCYKLLHQRGTPATPRRGSPATMVKVRPCCYRQPSPLLLTADGFAARFFRVLLPAESPTMLWRYRCCGRRSKPGLLSWWTMVATMVDGWTTFAVMARVLCYKVSWTGAELPVGQGRAAALP